jgi:hypothetical protein
MESWVGVLRWKRRGGRKDSGRDIAASNDLIAKTTAQVSVNFNRLFLELLADSSMVRTTRAAIYVSNNVKDEGQRR